MHLVIVGEELLNSCSLVLGFLVSFRCVKTECSVKRSEGDACPIITEINVNSVIHRELLDGVYPVLVYLLDYLPLSNVVEHGDPPIEATEDYLFLGWVCLDNTGVVEELLLLFTGKIKVLYSFSREGIIDLDFNHSWLLLFISLSNLFDTNCAESISAVY